MSTYQQVIHSYARRHGLSPSQRQLLEHASSGLSGAHLAAALRITLSELRTLETMFERRRGCSLNTAVEDVNTIVRGRSRRSSTTARIRDRALKRAHERETSDRRKSG